ncbi:TPA: hypothetical protein VPF83_001190 [Streptococcus pyogenes]|uniref:hypothetical protein n=1 Tax=Streptococcus pyogenes TaxID=1314 RepID=UPI001027328C|nr:hypothetical protein [Streptococcus pyogenes]MCX2500740.1 hypothetical protein [Streptococcus pyogenes]MCX2508880.1 hypothetical protein [Streptococcus pyogenes]NBA03932.1 hypothetical protein [Streptococcus pyogenes]QXF26049.1 hypothetical protein VB13_00950 [Streptococcus pyogenes]RXS60562.1 hypothetical protein ER615_08925 [Streptococcus pyogenes]
MKQQSYQPLRFVYLLVALFAAMLLVARPVMADEEESAGDRAYNQGLKQGTEAGKTAGESAKWTDLTPPDPTTIPESPSGIEEAANKQLYKEGYTDGYKLGYDETFSERFPWLIPVKFIWGIILHWWGK